MGIDRLSIMGGRIGYRNRIKRYTPKRQPQDRGLVAPNIPIVPLGNGSCPLIGKLPWMRTIVYIFASAFFRGLGLRFLFFFAFAVGVFNRLKYGMAMVVGGISNQFIFFFEFIVRVLLK